MLNIPFIADLQSIRLRRQELVDKNLQLQNRKRIQHDYRINEQILLSIPDPTKLEPKFIGPFTITQVHSNGTVTFQRRPHIVERINIRRIKPYRAYNR